ncbi:MAG: hypothetical protein M0Z50_15000, partial [Planctomycetia bacterium]|nr:hypothetical protein [Planctomycetia bacterium]
MTFTEDDGENDSKAGPIPEVVQISQRMFQEPFDVSHVFTMTYNHFSDLYVATNYLPIWHIAFAFNFI